MILNSCYSHRGVIAPNLGDTIRIGDIDYLVVHIDNEKNLIYVGKKYWDSAEDTAFDENGSTAYENSTIHNKCKTWYDKKIPNSIKSLLIATGEGFGCTVFIPTQEQVKDIFDYFDTNTKMTYTTKEGGVQENWYIQKALGTTHVYTACGSGADFISAPARHNAFRPFMALRTISDCSIVLE